MPFHYYIKPNPSSTTHPFSTRPDPQPAMTEAEFLSAVATRAVGRTPEQVAAVLDAMRDVFRQAARETIPVEAIRGFFRTQPTSGGAFSAPDSTITATTAGASYSFILSRDEITEIQAGLEMESSGLLGGRTPEVTTVRTMPQGEVNRWRASGGLEARGDNLRDGANGPLPTGALVSPIPDTDPIALGVIDVSEKRALLTVPAGVPAGPRFLEITVSLNGRNQTTRYPTMLEFAA